MSAKRGGKKTRAQMRNEQKIEIERLIKTVHPRSKPPHSFGLWPPGMMLMWLRQNQK
jgi:hypothetical protein